MPDEDPYNLNFETLGIKSELFLSNIGFAIYIIFFYCLVATILLCLYCLRNTHRYVFKLFEKVSSVLNWNTVNRLFIEMFLVFALYSVLNLHVVDWQSEFTSIRASNAVSVAALSLLCGTLAFYILRYICMPREDRLAVYVGKFGPLFSDADKEGEISEKRYLILVPVFYFIKRLLFVSLVIFAQDFVWL